ncbi:1-deoxyxylulose-5-phosphate synthase YajO [Usitatibacter rugosus]|uniref:1-deoxyxylulose-5-phosphate synthase YajO n=1 Tax=Usitatibacter rugosus TaxID=2732067 RepID=A0A6M4H4T0_9PROT|nr:aldo/keto reductase [Usitatibacter rugosus]QJR12937.1 1-deoxyxylulose-5-phosphate synthase YajO [Usitatibacter rugosus]
MDYRSLGESGLKVSPICLGTMMFGDRTDPNEAARIVSSARTAGVNFIDTANVYARGDSERVVGEFIRPHRAHWVLATKVANIMGDGPNDRGLSKAHMVRALDASLDRLHTDYIDLYYLHKDDTSTPLEETLRAMDGFIRAGKVRYWALSNYRAWRIAEVMRLCDALGMPRPIALQPYYNAMNRMPEVEVLPACAYYGMGVVPYSPLARGVLTGKYKAGAKPPEDSRAGRGDKRIAQTEFREESMKYAEKMAAHAKKKGVTPGQFATAWVLASDIVTSVLAGPRTLEQWEEYLGALNVKWAPEDEALVDGLVAPGHPSTPGYSDPMYPFFGRTRSGNPVRSPR